MIRKNIQAYLIINFKSGNVRVLKKKPSPNRRGSDVVINLDLDFNIPSIKEYKMKGEVTIPETTLQKSLIEEI